MMSINEYVNTLINAKRYDIVNEMQFVSKNGTSYYAKNLDQLHKIMNDFDGQYQDGKTAGMKQGLKRGAVAGTLGTAAVGGAALAAKKLIEKRKQMKKEKEDKQTDNK